MQLVLREESTETEGKWRVELVSSSLHWFPPANEVMELMKEREGSNLSWLIFLLSAAELMKIFLLIDWKAVLWSLQGF